jgi:hypothetical protein
MIHRSRRGRQRLTSRKRNDSRRSADRTGVLRAPIPQGARLGAASGQTQARSLQSGMLRSRRPRMYALVFAALFLGSGFVLPDLDALLYHSVRVSSEGNATHLELPGGCGAHSERCAIALATPVLQLAPYAPQAHSTSLKPAQATPAPLLVLPSSSGPLLHPSRAPPEPAS